MTSGLVGAAALCEPADDAGHASMPSESAVRFGAHGELVGVFTAAAGVSGGKPAVVFINAGMVHRVGPNRLYVNLARRLALQGFPSVRFDLSGIGDSQNRRDRLPADESAVHETCEVMTALQRVHGIDAFILAGLCSGAVTAFRAAVRDDRVVGGVLLNPQGFHHDPAWNAYVEARVEARRYVRSAAFTAEKWSRALTGRIDYRRLFRVLRDRVFRGSERGAVSPIAADLAEKLRMLGARGVRMLVACSEGDSSVEYMSAILGRDLAAGYASAFLAVKLFSHSDHSLTLTSSQRALFETVDDWAAGFGG
jgi:pimeloyl-ACP methyl ester carboxylesterase